MTRWRRRLRAPGVATRVRSRCLLGLGIGGIGWAGLWRLGYPLAAPYTPLFTEGLLAVAPWAASLVPGAAGQELHWLVWELVLVFGAVDVSYLVALLALGPSELAKP